MVGVDRVTVDRNKVTNNKTMGLAMADFYASGRSKQDAIGGIPYEDRAFA